MNEGMEQGLCAMDAWKAFTAQDYGRAAEIWSQLTARARDQSERLDYDLGYAVTLLAQRRFRDAEILLREHYERSGASACLHLMGFLAYQSGRLEIARSHLLAEQAGLAASDFLARAMNAYALGMVALSRDELGAAFQYARLSAECSRQSGHALAISCSYQLMGDVRTVLKDYEKAEDCYSEFKQALARNLSERATQAFDARLASFLIALPQLQSFTQAV